MDKVDKSNVIRDHDLIVTVNVKLDNLAIAVKDIKDDLMTRVAKTEARLDNVDIFHASIPLKDYEALAEWVKNFRANLKFILTVGGLALVVGGGLASQLIAHWFNIK